MGDIAKYQYAHSDAGEPDKPAPRMRMVCGTCGSENVMRDAWAVWNEETQQWELGNVFDAGFCEQCDGETHIEEQPI